jgi:hypothetical protein
VWQPPMHQGLVTTCICVCVCVGGGVDKDKELTWTLLSLSMGKVRHMLWIVRFCQLQAG